MMEGSDPLVFSEPELLAYLEQCPGGTVWEVEMRMFLRLMVAMCFHPGLSAYELRSYLKLKGYDYDEERKAVG
jgi:hypothetical protein